jgi:hypothetical protein
MNEKTNMIKKIYNNEKEEEKVIFRCYYNCFVGYENNNVWKDEDEEEEEEEGGGWAG